MKKGLLVAALLGGMLGAAQAETSVTLYGVLDGGLYYQRLKGAGQWYDNARVSEDLSYTRFSSGFDSGNRWGLTGKEDLGEGLQAIFKLESGFNLGTGQSGQGGRLFGRQATVGLRSDAWGRLELGRQTTIASEYVADVASPFNNSYGQASVGSVIDGLDTLRLDNTIMYQTPVVAGLQLGVGYSFNRNGPQRFPSSDQNTRAWTAGLRYSNGPLTLAAGFDRTKSPESLDSIAVRSWNLAASYDFGVAVVHAGIGQARNGWQSALEYGSYSTSDVLNQHGIPNNEGYFVNKGMRVNSYALGVGVPVGEAGNVMLAWGMADPRDSGQLISRNVMGKTQLYAVGYTYTLSKRTRVYAVGSYIKNVAMINGLKSTQLGAGIRHAF